MIKVITYGTYDLLHLGHIRLLERAKALGDYLIVGVTSDDYDKTRGKINAAQSLMERIEAVRATGLADEIVVEEYEGQKIDDIRRYGVDIFTVGSDWVGKFDYLNEFCKVIYLPRTEGVSSSEIRAQQRTIRIGLLGSGRVVEKYKAECGFVNGLSVAWVCEDEAEYIKKLGDCDAVYIQSHPTKHEEHIRMALEAGKHVLCESPVALSAEDGHSMFELARRKGVVLMDAIKTAYSTAYNRMLLLIKSGKIGDVLSVDVTCTSLMDDCDSNADYESLWNSRCAWGPAPLLVVLQILGVGFLSCDRVSFYAKESDDFDIFTCWNFKYNNAVATVRVAKGVKAEGCLIVAGTKGYVYVPAPWWKTEYFEIRYEASNNNQRYYYQLLGEGIRNELVAFIGLICSSVSKDNVGESMSCLISKICSEEEV